MGNLAPLLTALAIASVIIAAFLQQYLPAPPPAVVGIDLGTTHSCVGVFKNGVGGVDIVPDENGRMLLPSVVAFTQKGHVVGYPAREHQVSNSKNTIFDAKRFIGKKFEDRQLQQDMSLYPFDILQVNGYPKFKVQVKGQESLLSPEDISSLVLAELRKRAAKFLGKSVIGAVVAVPVEFNEAQREATREAGRKIGLDIMRIISEPTAAAIAYGLHERQDVSLILVFDFGGGTLDVSLLSVQHNVFEVLEVSGDDHLGGEDFNYELIKHYIKEINERCSTNITEKQDMIQLVRNEVERVKIKLSTKEKATFEVQVEGCGSFSDTLSRAEFEQIAAPVFSRILSPIEEVLEVARVPAESIDEIVLVGGSTRVPNVQKLLRKRFGKEPNTRINPDQAVAVGTAIQAGIITDSWPVPVAAVERPYARNRRPGSRGGQ